MSAAPIATETIDERFRGLDTWDDVQILTSLLEGQQRALASVTAALPQLARAANAAATQLLAGGRLVYCASGSPALMSLADALEIPQTYGIAHERIVLALSDKDIGHRLDGGREDDAAGARDDIAALRLGSADILIATSASGSTAYTVAGLETARAAGATTVGIAGNAGSPLLVAADIPVLLDAGPEVISGSTRLGAGTAQKAALNMISTLMGVRMGHVHDGLMVNVTADNAKLRGRAARIVQRITGVDGAMAAAALEATGGVVKPAVLLAAGAADADAALSLLARHQGHLRPALAALDTGNQ